MEISLIFLYICFMKIQKLYKTSKGVFLTPGEAHKNRVREYDSYLMQKVYEKVDEIFVLFDEETGKYFKLKEVEVGFTDIREKELEHRIK